MGFTKLVGQTVTATATEANAEGQAIAIVPANIQWSIDDPTVGQLTVNADGSATIGGLKAGTVVVTVKDTGFNLSASDSGTFSADSTPTSIAITFA